MTVCNIKEKRLRALLKEFCKETAEGDWIIPLNPTNIEFEFTDLYRNDESMLFGDVIYFDPDHEAKHLFPYLVKELWLIKQKREHRLRYWLCRILNLQKIYQEAEEKETIAYEWLLRKNKKNKQKEV